MTAKFGTITTNAVINVQAVKSIAVGPAIPIVNPSILNIAQGTASQFVATATLTDGTTQDISNSATWVAISPPAVSGTGPVATISDTLGSSGWATGNAPGTAVIAAVFGGQSNLSSVTVTNATLKTLAITPTGNVHVVFGGTQQYQATGTFSDSTTQNLTNQVTWNSSAANGCRNESYRFSHQHRARDDERECHEQYHHPSHDQSGSGFRQPLRQKRSGGLLRVSPSIETDAFRGL